MTTPEVPLFDPANPYVQGVPAMVTYGVIDTPQGQRMVMTFRTVDTTLSLVVDKATGDQWHKLMGETLSQMSSLTVAPAGLRLPPLAP